MNKKTAKGCASVCGAIARYATIIFVALRACEVIDWAWYWVLSPTLVAIFAGILLLACRGAATISEEDDESN